MHASLGFNHRSMIKKEDTEREQQSSTIGSREETVLNLHDEEKKYSRVYR